VFASPRKESSASIKLRSMGFEVVEYRLQRLLVVSTSRYFAVVGAENEQPASRKVVRITFSI